MFHFTHKITELLFTAERDYVPQVQSLIFAPGETEKIVKLIILDDIARPRIEGKENFTVLLRVPLNATLGENPSATVTIDDTKSDRKNFMNASNFRLIYT